MMFEKYKRTRKSSEDMVKSISSEEWRIQPMLDVSPLWWNLGHTSWFFARNILKDFGDYLPIDGTYDYLLNSYYHSLGERIERGNRGLITRPTNAEVLSYRKSVDERILRLLERGVNKERVRELTRVGIEHEQQHQELFFTEIKHIRFQNIVELRQTYKKIDPNQGINDSGWTDFKGDIYHIGNKNENWGWDNEYAIHERIVHDFSLKNNLVTNKEFIEFIEREGYEDPLLWLSNGWDAKVKNNWNSPLYWSKEGNKWYYWTLQGQKPVNINEPVSHVSFYEADAFARWRGTRLPTEFEWEVAARVSEQKTEHGNFMESGIFHPIAPDRRGLKQMLGNLWEWTSSHYEPYPRYKPFQGELTEYNGKFMDNQRVLRGGSCATPNEHIRISYRNFWHPATRFQFSGIRLARDK